MLRSRVLGLAAAVLLAAGSVATAADVVGPKMQQQGSPRRYDAKRSLFGGSLGGSSYGRRARPGWSNRQVQRMAAKRRNKARHRKACR